MCVCFCMSCVTILRVRVSTYFLFLKYAFVLVAFCVSADECASLRVFFFLSTEWFEELFFFHLKKPDREKSFFWLKTVDQQLFSLTGSVCFCVCRCVTGLWCMDRPS